MLEVDGPTWIRGCLASRGFKTEICKASRPGAFSWFQRYIEIVFEALYSCFFVDNADVVLIHGENQSCLTSRICFKREKEMEQNGLQVSFPKGRSFARTASAFQVYHTVTWLLQTVPKTLVILVPRSKPRLMPEYRAAVSLSWKFLGEAEKVRTWAGAALMYWWTAERSTRSKELVGKTHRYW